MQSKLSKNGWTIVPYVQRKDGTWTLSENDMVYVLAKMAKAGLVEKVFYQGEVKNQFDFISLVQNPRNHVHIVVNEDHEPIAIAWLNNVGFNHAFMHYCTFKEIWGKTVELGKFCIDYWLSFKKDDGMPLFDVLLGKTPVTNRLAIRFLKKIGMTELGVVPKIAWNDYLKQKADVVFSYIERGE